MKPLPGPLWQPLTTEAAYRAGTGLAADRSVKSLHRYGLVCLAGCNLQGSLGQVWFYMSSLGSALHESHGSPASTRHPHIPHCVTSGNLNYCSSVSPRKIFQSCLLCRPLLTSHPPVGLPSHLRASPRTPAFQGSFLSLILSAPDRCLRDVCKGSSLAGHQKTRSGPSPTCKDHAAPINFAGSNPISAWIGQFAPNFSTLKWVQFLIMKP